MPTVAYLPRYTDFATISDLNAWIKDLIQKIVDKYGPQDLRTAQELENLYIKGSINSYRIFTGGIFWDINHRTYDIIDLSYSHSNNISPIILLCGRKRHQ